MDAGLLSSGNGLARRAAERSRIHSGPAACWPVQSNRNSEHRSPRGPGQHQCRQDLHPQGAQQHPAQQGAPNLPAHPPRVRAEVHLSLQFFLMVTETLQQESEIGPQWPAHSVLALQDLPSPREIGSLRSTHLRREERSVSSAT